MSTIFGTCSMKTGQASTHQRQVVQAQSTLSWMVSPTRVFSGAFAPGWPSSAGASPQGQDEPLRVELLAAHVGRAARGTAAALGAVVGVEEILPGQVGQAADPEGLRVLEIHAAVLAF